MARGALRIMSKDVKPIATLLCLAISISGGNAAACGSPLSQLSLYWKAETAEQKTEFLTNLACSLHKAHAPRGFDPELARVLVNALESGVPNRVIRDRVSTFHCLHAARETAQYVELRSRIGEEEFNRLCDPESIGAMYVVTPRSGAYSGRSD